jgi:hypothetical protein
MKNIQIIDGAVNCAYCVYAIPDRVFKAIFPQPGQDVEFVEDLVKRVGTKAAGKLVMATHKPFIRKADVAGIHGTLFFGLLEKRPFYPNKRETDLDGTWPQRSVRRKS